MSDQLQHWSEETANVLSQPGAEEAGVWTWDRQHNQLFISSTARRLLGYQHFRGFEGAGIWLRRMHPEDRGLFLRDLRRHLEAVWPLVQGIYRIRHRDGNWTPLLITGVCVGRSSGQPEIVAGVVAAPSSALPGGERIGGLTNLLGGEPSPQVVTRELEVMGHHLNEVINDLVQHQQRLTERHRHLLADEKLVAVGKLAAGVVHEIRNPLTAIRMRLHALRRLLDSSPEAVKHVEIIAEEIVYLEHIIQDFLAFSRPQTPQLVESDIHQVIDQTLDLLEHEFAAGRIDLRCEYQPHLPRLRLDPAQIKQVLINLLRNAATAIGEEGGTITITTRLEHVPDAEPELVIFVEDDGPGVPADIAERIFDPFFSTRSEGTGLGLSICERIVDHHNGTLRLELSQPGSTVFAIHLPAFSTG